MFLYFRLAGNSVLQDFQTHPGSFGPWDRSVNEVNNSGASLTSFQGRKILIPEELMVETRRGSNSFNLLLSLLCILPGGNWRLRKALLIHEEAWSCIKKAPRSWGRDTNYKTGKLWGCHDGSTGKKYLLYEHGDMSLNRQHPCKKPGVEHSHAEVKAGGSCELNG